MSTGASCSLGFAARLLGTQLRGFLVKRRHEIVPCFKWSVGAAFFEVPQALCDAAINKRFRGKRDFPPLYCGLQEVAHVNTNLLADASRNHDLEFVFDRNQGHGSS